MTEDFIKRGLYFVVPVARIFKRCLQLGTSLNSFGFSVLPHFFTDFWWMNFRYRINLRTDDSGVGNLDQNFVIFFSRSDVISAFVFKRLLTVGGIS